MTASRGSVRIDPSPRVEPRTLAISMLRDLDMPRTEIDAILRADDPQLVRWYLELHRERLEERLAEQRAKLAGIETLLSGR